MSTIGDLKSVLEESLEKKGVLDQVKAKLRAEVYNVLEDNNDQIPKIPPENLLINELIREYLEFNQYKYTNSVFSKETGQPKNVLTRELITNELHMKEDQTTRQLPLLYSILWNFTNNEDYLDKNKRVVLSNEDEQASKINVYKYKTEYD